MKLTPAGGSIDSLWGDDDDAEAQTNQVTIGYMRYQIYTIRSGCNGLRWTFTSVVGWLNVNRLNADWNAPPSCPINIHSLACHTRLRTLALAPFPSCVKRRMHCHRPRTRPSHALPSPSYSPTNLPATPTPAVLFKSNQIQLVRSLFIKF